MMAFFGPEEYYTIGSQKFTRQGGRYVKVKHPARIIATAVKVPGLVLFTGYQYAEFRRGNQLITMGQFKTYMEWMRSLFP
jgi:hypothetical protein